MTESKRHKKVYIEIGGVKHLFKVFSSKDDAIKAARCAGHHAGDLEIHGHEEHFLWHFHLEDGHGNRLEEHPEHYTWFSEFQRIGIEPLLIINQSHFKVYTNDNGEIVWKATSKLEENQEAADMRKVKKTSPITSKKGRVQNHSEIGAEFGYGQGQQRDEGALFDEVTEGPVKWNKNAEEMIFLDGSTKQYELSPYCSGLLRPVEKDHELSPKAIKELKKAFAQEASSEASIQASKNSSNMDAGFAELRQSIAQVAQGGTVATATKAIERILITYEILSETEAGTVAKGFMMYYRASQEHGTVNPIMLGEAIVKQQQDWLREMANDRTQASIFAFNTLMTITCVDARIEYTGNPFDGEYAGAQACGYGIGCGTKMQTGQQGFSRDTGLHVSYRIPQTLGIIGVGGCAGKSDEALYLTKQQNNQASQLSQVRKNYGLHVKLDCLGVQIADAHGGYMSLEEYRSTTCYKEGQKVEQSTSRHLTGVGVAGRLGFAGEDELVEASVALGTVETSQLDISTNGGDGTKDIKQLTRTTCGLLADARVCGFQAIDMSSGVSKSVCVVGQDKSSGTVLWGTEEDWRTTTSSAGIVLLGLALEVPCERFSVSDVSRHALGFTFYKMEKTSEGVVQHNSHEKHTFCLFFEVHHDEKSWPLGLFKKQFATCIHASPELQCIVGGAAMHSINAFLDAKRRGLSFSEAWRLASTCFKDGLKVALMDAAMMHVGGNIACAINSRMPIEKLNLSRAERVWNHLTPHLSDAVAALVRPVVNMLTRKEYTIRDFGYDWLKQFVLFQLLKLLRDAGLSTSVLDVIMQSFPRIYDNIASGNPDLVQLLLDLVPAILEFVIKGLVVSGGYGWVITYIVVPILIAVVRTDCVQQLFGHIMHSAREATKALRTWVYEAIQRLAAWFRSLTADMVAVGAMAAVSAGAAAAATGTALAPAAVMAGSETLGALAVSYGLMAAPVAPAAAVLGVAAVSGVAAGLLVMRGYEEVKQALWKEDPVRWRDQLSVGCKVELLSRGVDGHGRRWVMGTVRKVRDASVTVVFGKDGDGEWEVHKQIRRDSKELRPAALEGAVLDAFCCQDDDEDPWEIGAPMEVLVCHAWHSGTLTFVNKVKGRARVDVWMPGGKGGLLRKWVDMGDSDQVRFASKPALLGVETDAASTDAPTESSPSSARVSDSE